MKNLKFRNLTLKIKNDSRADENNRKKEYKLEDLYTLIKDSVISFKAKLDI